MLSQALIGLLGGLITGISPCILPMLPIIFLAGATSAATGDERSRSRRYPLLVTLGLVVSFTLVTLLGSTLLSLLGLPQDFIRWMGIVLLAVIGIALMFPTFEEWLEKPFRYLGNRNVGKRSNGFVFGLLLGTAYVPCAGPVLTAITVAGSTGQIGLDTVVLAVSFATGAAIPLFFFALAGRGVTERVKGYRKHQRGIRIGAGVAMLGLSAGLAFNLPAALQRLIPDYTSSLQKSTDRLLNKGGQECQADADTLLDCGKQPAVEGIAAWLNTPGGKPLDAAVPKGGVRLVDFWAYSCINCQRSVPGIKKLYETYKSAGLQVLGVHSPEYAFEKVTENVREGAKKLGVTYPVAVDSDLRTWKNFDNHYWPAQYLVDGSGKVRHIHYGEGGEATAEKLIRRLLTEQNPGVKLPDPVFTENKSGARDGKAGSPAERTNPETYLFPSRASYYAGRPQLREGTADYGDPGEPKRGTFNLAGAWNAGAESITPARGSAQVRLGLHARRVYLVASGEGEVTYTFAGKTYTKKVSGTPNAVDLLPGGERKEGTLKVEASSGVHLHSFTFG